MGKKNKNIQKSSRNGLVNNSTTLSPQKRSDLNHLVERLLKATSQLSSQSASNWDNYIEINSILEKIISLESDISKELLPRDNVMAEELTEWMVENGAHINGIRISEYEDLGFGLSCTRDIFENDLIVKVPRKLMLTSDYAEKSDIGILASGDPMLQHMPHVKLALLVLIERFKKDSFWSHYINMLPGKYNTVMYFSPEEMKLLKGSPTYESALKQCKNIARQYAYFYNIFCRSESLPSHIKDIFTFEHYRWAVSTVSTRQNSIPSVKPDGGMINALIPFWDMANHTNGKVTTDFNLDEDSSECYACQDFIAGSQFKIYYGERSNHDLFIHNGFVYPENLHDSIGIPLGISHSDILHEKRTLLLQDLNLRMSGLYTLKKGFNPITSELFCFLRVFCMSEGDLDLWNSSSEKKKLFSDDCQIDQSLDKRVLEFLLMRIKLVLSTYKTTMQEDEKMLNNKANEVKINKCMELAILQVLSEKKILMNAIEYIQEKLKGNNGC